MTALTHCYWTVPRHLHTKVESFRYLGANKEDLYMRRHKKTFNWLYLVQAEDSTTPVYSRLNETCKTCVWLGISILIGVGVGQLT